VQRPIAVIKGKKATVDHLAPRKFSDATKNNIAVQVFNNITVADAKVFETINITKSTLTISQDQFRVITEQIGQLNPAGLRAQAMSALQSAIKSGAVRIGRDQTVFPIYHIYCYDHRAGVICTVNDLLQRRKA